jgi:hypothetical protein
VVRVNRDEFDVAMHWAEDAAFSRRFRVLYDDGAYTCQQQCTQDFGHYSVLTASNVAWEDPAPPSPSGDSIQLEEHLAHCDRPLLRYHTTPYVFLPPSLGEVDVTGRCRACGERCEGELYHCARCLYDVCARCQLRQQRTE